MLLKLKFNIFQKKLKRPLFNINLFKKHGKEFNIYPLKPKLSTTLKEKDMLLVKLVSISKPIELSLLEVPILLVHIPLAQAMLLEVKLIVTLQQLIKYIKLKQFQQQQLIKLIKHKLSQQQHPTKQQHINKPPLAVDMVTQAQLLDMFQHQMYQGLLGKPSFLELMGLDQTIF
jgi:hypothetical protein